MRVPALTGPASGLAAGLAAAVLAVVPLAPVYGAPAAPPTTAPTTAPTATPTAAPAAAPTVTDGCLDSVPDPGTTTPVQICWTLFQPAGASARNPVPMVLHSHGWGGSRTTDPAAFAYLLDAGFGVLSFDQRGWGQSGGHAQIENPDFEGQDVIRVVDLVAGLPWVEQNAPGDPVLGAIGGSYGGGYQFVGAFTELRDRGRTRFDALVPEITWHSLTESLFPQGVPRALWALALVAAAVPSDALPPVVLQGFAEAVATGDVPQSLYDFLGKNGPAWHVAQGRRLDVPVLFGQGETDNLFPLDEGLDNYAEALTPRARARSIFVGYNGGHTLPALLPPGTNGLVDPTPDTSCAQALGSPDFRTLGLRFLQQNLQGRRGGLTGYGAYHLATAGGRCVSTPSVRPNTDVPLGSVVSTVGVGVPQSVPIARGPLTVAGQPTLDATLTTVGLDNRVFVSLAVGTSPLDAKVVQNNVLPLREVGTVLGKPRRGVELPAVAVDVPAGQTLFLTVTPVSDMSAGFGSRVVGAMVLRDVTVHLPLVATGRKVAGLGAVSAIDDLLAECREGDERVRPEDLAAEVAAGALLVDTRPVEQRERDGALPESVVVDRNVLEWRLDPTSPDRLPQADADLRVVVVCNEGYSSSLAAHTLRTLGVRRATDLVGGFQAWRALG